VFEGVAEHAHTEKPRGHIPRPLARAVLRTPGLSRLGRGPSAFVDLLDHPVHYDQTNTARALVGTTVRCPSLPDYLPTLVRYVIDVSRPPARPSSDDITDSLRGVHRTRRDAPRPGSVLGPALAPARPLPGPVPTPPRPAPVEEPR
jgi:hypothetical protein